MQSTNAQADIIQQKITDGHEIRPFPGAVSQLLTALKDPNATPKTFAEIIELDAALSTRILRMVNSPIYGFSNEIRSIGQAVSILGRNPLKNVALAFAGASMISGKGQTGNQHEALWSHSLGCAATARVLANLLTSVSQEDAFLAGIFHDIGKLFFLDVVPQEYADLAVSCSGESLLEQETEQLGTTHVEVGFRLTVTWPLANEIKSVIRYHHHPEEDPSENPLTALITVSDALARAEGIGSPADPNINAFELAEKHLSLNESIVESIREKSVEAFEELKAAYSLS